MAGKGSAPGEHRGGRTKGTPNKATIEKQVVEAYQREAARLTKATGKQQPVRKLAKEMLEDFAVVFSGLAARYQLRSNAKGENINPLHNEAKFDKYAGMAVDAADRAAPYQSPTFRAIMVAPAPQSLGGKVTRFTLSIFDAKHLPGDGANDAAPVELPAPAAKAG